MATTNDSNKPLSTKEALDFYENGKHRRYTLLFAVNGGGFALAKLIQGGGAIGGLGLAALSLGMFILSVVMVADIWLFGDGRRKDPYFNGGQTPANMPDLEFFGFAGKLVLNLTGTLITTGWLLVGVGYEAVALVPLVVFVIVFFVSWLNEINPVPSQGETAVDEGKITTGPDA